MRQLDIDDLHDLALGAAILGSGGGGSPDYDLLIAEQHLMDYGKTCLFALEEIADDALVAPIAFAGAPLVASEQLPSGLECERLLDAIADAVGRRPDYLMPAEIGGANGLCPFLYAARLGMPVVDGDSVGRAFPEMQMSSCNLHGVSSSPAFIVDVLGRSMTVCEADSRAVETKARQAIVEMGSSALVGLYLMDGKTAKKAAIDGSVTRSIRLGREIRYAKERGANPAELLAANHGATVLGAGYIEDIQQQVDAGFLKGRVLVATNEGQIAIDYQNEYLRAMRNGKCAAVTPDIIVMVESESYQPIASEKLLFGMRATVFTLPAPPVWTTAAGLKLVGHEYFGYDNRSLARTL